MTAATIHHKPTVWARWMQAFNARIARLGGAQPEAGLDALPVRVHGTEFARTGASPVHVKGFDQPLVWVTFALLMIGLVMVYSASIAMPDNPRTGSYYTQTHFLIRWHRAHPIPSVPHPVKLRAQGRSRGAPPVRPPTIISKTRRVLP